MSDVQAHQQALQAMDPAVWTPHWDDEGDE